MKIFADIITAKHLITRVTEELAIELCVSGCTFIMIAAVGEELLFEYAVSNMKDLL